MEIIFQGKHDSDDAAKSLSSIIHLFEERYHIHQFREIHLSVTLVDEAGEDVELVDSETSEVYRIFEVYREGEPVMSLTEKSKSKSKGKSLLRLVVDNTHKL